MKPSLASFFNHRQFGAAIHSRESLTIIRASMLLQVRQADLNSRLNDLSKGARFGQWSGLAAVAYKMSQQMSC